VPTMLERLRDAQNAHDAEGLAACFAEDYASTQRCMGAAHLLVACRFCRTGLPSLRVSPTLFPSWCRTPSTARLSGRVVLARTASGPLTICDARRDHPGCP
jgi:hypothetical protein